MLEIRPITETIWMLRLAVVNAYAVRLRSGLALVDTGIPGDEADLLPALGELGGDTLLRFIVLTHSHKDHAGSAAALAAATGAAVLAGADDAPVITGTVAEPEAVITDEERPYFDQIAPTILPAPPVTVDRPLRDGDEIEWNGPTAAVIAAPGHTAGSIAIYLPDDRVLLTGDNIASVDGKPILGPFNVARQQAIESFRKLAELDADIACFGHGEPIIGNAAAALRRSAARL